MIRNINPNYTKKKSYNSTIKFNFIKSFKVGQVLKTSHRRSNRATSLQLSQNTHDEAI